MKVCWKTKLISNFIKKNKKSIALVLNKLFRHLRHDAFKIPTIINREPLINSLSQIVDCGIDRTLRGFTFGCEFNEVTPSILHIGSASDQPVPFHSFKCIGQGGLFDIKMSV